MVTGMTTVKDDAKAVQEHYLPCLEKERPPRSRSSTRPTNLTHRRNSRRGDPRQAAQAALDELQAVADRWEGRDDGVQGPRQGVAGQAAVRAARRPPAFCCTDEHGRLTADTADAAARIAPACVLAADRVPLPRPPVRARAGTTRRARPAALRPRGDGRHRALGAVPRGARRLGSPAPRQRVSHRSCPGRRPASRP